MPSEYLIINEQIVTERNQSTHPASFLLNLYGKDSQPSRRIYNITHVHRAYKKPPKQNAAMIIRITNCAIIARRERTIRLFCNVTNANLFKISR